MKSSPYSIKLLIPFLAGIAGASVVLAVYTNIPNTKSLNNSENLSNTNSISASSHNLSNLPVSKVSSLDIGSDVAQKVLPSVVGIEVEYLVNSIFGEQGTSKASGSGIIMSKDGYILTNNHVVNSMSGNSFYRVSEANKVVVYLYNDSTPYPAEIIGTDKTTDLAVIKINKVNLTAAEIGDSNDLKIGQFAMAVGNPLGFSSSVSTGSISAVNREIQDSSGYKYTLIQTDAAINSGNSGGALVNSKGQVIGINFMKISSVGVEGISFAIPINPSMEVFNKLVNAFENNKSENNFKNNIP